MSGERLPTRQQRVINNLLTSGWEENGAPNRLKKGNRRVYVGVKETNFSVQLPDGPGFVEVLPTSDFKRIKELM